MPEASDIARLLETDRELTPAEMEQLRSASNSGWTGIAKILGERAQVAYSVVSRDDLADCLYAHMDGEDDQEMITADAYHCPVCGRLLKDRRNAAASGILLERQRIQQLWKQVEATKPEEFSEAVERFRRALGLT